MVHPKPNSIQCEIKSPSSSQDVRLLDGRNICIKDNISVGGLPHTCGTFPQLLSKTGKHQLSTIDASVVSRVLEAGGTIKGTATCENYSLSPLSYGSASGPVQNPWTPGYTTGGSSSGCAALIAASRARKWRQARGMPLDQSWGPECDLGIGGDQGGSIRLVSF